MAQFQPGETREIPGSTNKPGLTGVMAVAAGWAHNVVLLSNGTVVAWGDSGSWGITQVPSGLSNVVALAAVFSTPWR